MLGKKVFSWKIECELIRNPLRWFTQVDDDDDDAVESDVDSGLRLDDIISPLTSNSVYASFEISIWCVFPAFRESTDMRFLVRRRDTTLLTSTSVDMETGK